MLPTNYDVTFSCIPVWRDVHMIEKKIAQFIDDKFAGMDGLSTNPVS